MPGIWRWVGGLVAAATMGMPAGALAQETISASRPGSAEDAAVVSAGVFQVEAGYSLDRNDAATEHALGELLFRVGVGGRVELVAGLSSFAWESAHGFGGGAWEGATAGAKLSLREAAPGVVPGMAVTAGVTGAEGARGDGYDFTPQVGGHLEWLVGHRWSLLATGAWYGTDGPDEALWVGGVGYHAAHALHLHLELERHGEAPWGGAGDVGGSDHTDSAHLVAEPGDGHVPAVHASDLIAVGASYLIGPDLVVDTWAGIEESHGVRSLRFGLGFARRWGAQGAEAVHDPRGEHH